MRLLLPAFDSEAVVVVESAVASASVSLIIAMMSPDIEWGRGSPVSGMLRTLLLLVVLSGISSVAAATV